MADRIPLVVDGSNYRIEEIPAGDSLDLRATDVKNATFTGVTTVSSLEFSSENILKRVNGSVSAITISGVGSIGINTVSPHYMQIGSFKEYSVVGLNTVGIASTAWNAGTLTRYSLNELYNDPASAFASGIGTVVNRLDVTNNGHSFTLDDDINLRFWNVQSGQGSSQFVTGGITLVDIDSYNGVNPYPDGYGYDSELTSVLGVSSDFNPTPVGIASVGIFVGVGCSDPRVRLDVEGDIFVRNKAIFFGMDTRNNNNYELIWCADNETSPGSYHFVADGRHRSAGNAQLVAHNFYSTQASNLASRRPNYFSTSVGVGTSVPNGWLGGSALGTNVGAAATHTLHLVGTFIYQNRPAAASVTNIGVDASGIVREATSSRRFKENIEPYTKGLSDVEKLNPVTFNYIGEEGVTLAGLIAEEVDEAGLNEYVIREENGTPKAINYGHMMALMTNAIKELKAENEALKARLDAAGL